jgi:hypothetical protein
MEGTKVPTLLMPKVLAEHLDHGLFISLPKIKAHRFAVFSMAIKGVQGTIMLADAMPAFRQKWRMHRELGAWLDAKKKGDTPERAEYVRALEIFAERIVDVLEVEAPDVVLAEGAPMMSGDGFQKLVPSAEKVAVGGTNPVLVDRVGAELLGLFRNHALAEQLGGHSTSPLLEVAAKRFGVPLGGVATTGDGADLLGKGRPVHFVGMAGFSIHGEPGASSDGTEAPRPTVHAAPAGSGLLTLDGRLDEPAWSTAKPVTWSTDWSGAEAGIATTARFLWSPEALYASFVLQDAGLNTDLTRPIDVEREKLWAEDCVELFVDPTPETPRGYHEIEVGPFGHFLDLTIGKGGKGEVAWSADLRIGTTRDAAKKTATIEIAIRSPDVTSALRAGARLGLGLFRMEGTSPRHYLAWSPTRTPKPNFHVPEKFGLLAIDP